MYKFLFLFYRNLLSILKIPHTANFQLPLFEHLPVQLQTITMKVFSVLAAIVASALVGQTIAVPVANAVAERSDMNERGLVNDASVLYLSVTDRCLQATMFYGCKFAPEETEVDDADPDKLKKLIKERVSLRISVSPNI